MKLALNYSDEAAHLLDEGRLDVDLYKCPDWPGAVEVAQQQRPTYVHFPLKAGRLEGAVDLSRVADFREATGTPFVNTHLDPEVGAASGPISGVHRAVERTIEHVEGLIARFGAENVIVENVPYWQNENHHERLASLPAFVSTVVEETGCGLLLDLAHARIAACEHGIDEITYLNALPTHRLRELHVSGTRVVDGWYRDHMPLDAEDWNAVRWALRRIGEGGWARPDVVACEYGGLGPRFSWRTSPGVLAEQIPRLRALVREADGRRTARRDAAETASPHRTADLPVPRAASAR
jgi:hypothetical protein